MFEGKRILITGGTGSLGTSIIKRLLSLGEYESITIFSRGEAKQYDMKMSYPGRLKYVIGDVRDYRAVLEAITDIDIVIHAAALKQVGACEENPFEAHLTNITGAENIARAVIEGYAKPEVVVGVSTDKACQPVNVYGATKFLQERTFVWANSKCNTRFVCVRYGNVMGSQGSVIPVFQKQIKQGGPVTVTEPLMTRFLVTLDLAVDTLFAAIEYAAPGEIFIPRNLPSATVGDIAALMVGKRDIKIEIVGMRPGEKMHEILISCDEVERTIKRNGYYVVTPDKQSKPALVSLEYDSSEHVVSQSCLTELFRKEGLI